MLCKSSCISYSLRDSHTSLGWTLKPIEFMQPKHLQFLSMRGGTQGNHFQPSFSINFNMYYASFVSRTNRGKSFTFSFLISMSSLIKNIWKDQKLLCCENIYEQKEHYSFAFLWQVVTIMAKMSNFCHSKRTKSVSQFHLKHPSRILWSISNCRILCFHYLQFKKKCGDINIHLFS